jgi:hypothetical protein
MTVLGSTGTEVSAPAPRSASLPAEQHTGAAIRSAANSCPYEPVGREAFRSAAEGSAFGFASPEMSLWSPDRNLKTAATDFKEAG